jgi:hypothetical protein
MPSERYNRSAISALTWRDLTEFGLLVAGYVVLISKKQWLPNTHPVRGMVQRHARRKGNELDGSTLASHIPMQL